MREEWRSLKMMREEEVGEAEKNSDEVDMVDLYA